MPGGEELFPALTVGFEEGGHSKVRTPQITTRVAVVVYVTIVAARWKIEFSSSSGNSSRLAASAPVGFAATNSGANTMGIICEVA